MSLPTDSVAPAPPTGTSNPWPLWQWFKRITDWIAALSPSGASVYDTGPVAVPLAAGFTGTCDARRVGSLVEITFNVTGTLPAGNTGITGNSAVPAEMRPTGNRRGPSFVGGLASGGCYVTSTGLVGIRNDTGASRTAADGSILYLLS